MNFSIDDMHAALQDVLNQTAPSQLGVFDTYADTQIVFDLQSLQLGGWESGRPRIAYGTYNVQIYQKDYDPLLPQRCLATLLSHKMGAVMNGEAYVDSAGYTVAGLTASLWKEIDYGEHQ